MPGDKEDRKRQQGGGVKTHLSNKMKTAAFIFAIIMQCSATFAQHSVRGQVTDEAGSPIDAAVVTLVNPDNGEALGQYLTTSDGEYIIDAGGKVQQYIDCLGFKPYFGQPFYLHTDTIMPQIVLSRENFGIDSVTVVGERLSQSVSIDGGKMVFTPGNSSTLAGGSAIEVLRKTPGISIDSEGGISIAGRNNVLVTIDGRQTYMQRDELAAMLRAIPASSVSSVEVQQSPSAQHDAQGSGGIININTDKRNRKGISLSLNNGLSLWDNLRENTELSFSYAKGKLNLTGSYSHTVGNYSMEYGMHRIQGGKDYYSPTHDTDKRKTISGNLGVEYALDSKQTIGARIDINTLFGPGQTITTTEVRDETHGTLEETLLASNDYYKQKGNRYGANLYYTASPRNGTSYAIDFNYAWFDGGSGNMQPNRHIAPDGSILQDNLYKSENRRNIHICAMSYDQCHALWKGELKSGLKISSVNAANDYHFYDMTGQVEVMDETQSNDFDYSERILAAYISYTHSIGKRINVEAGLRGEYTLSHGILHPLSGSDDESHKRDYFNLFPTFAIDFRPGAGHTLVLSYASRIDRPAYQDMNPFEYLLDELSRWKGNPFLIPQKTHQLSLTWQYRQTAVTASYSRTNDYKAQITDTLSLDKVIMTPRNIGRQRRAQLSLHQGLDITRWWEMNLDITCYYVSNDIAFDRHRQFDLDGLAGTFSMQNTIRLPWQIRMEINAACDTRHLGASNEYVEPSGYVDVGLTKSFAERKWTISLAMSDIFWTSRWDNSSSFDGLRLWNWGKGESRQVKLNVTYKFGKDKSNRHSSNFDEIQRL